MVEPPLECAASSSLAAARSFSAFLSCSVTAAALSSASCLSTRASSSSLSRLLTFKSLSSLARCAAISCKRCAKKDDCSFLLSALARSVASSAASAACAAVCAACAAAAARASASRRASSSFSRACRSSSSLTCVAWCFSRRRPAAAQRGTCRADRRSRSGAPWAEFAPARSRPFAASAAASCSAIQTAIDGVRRLVKVEPLLDDRVPAVPRATAAAWRDVPERCKRTCGVEGGGIL